MAAHEAQAYQDPGTPEEQSRRQFLANVTIAVGGVIGLVIAVPVLTSLVPDSLIRKGSGKGQWTPLSSAEFSKLEASADSPLRLDISFKRMGVERVLEVLDALSARDGVREVRSSVDVRRPTLI